MPTANSQSPSDNTARAVAFFKNYDKNHPELAAQFYDKDIEFEDPVHHVRGIKAMEKYYEGLYKNVETIRFEFSKTITDGDTSVLIWTMYLKTASLNGGKEFSLAGTSVITFGGPEGKAIKHRDYFDMGEFIYERVPVLKSIIHAIKHKLANS